MTCNLLWHSYSVRQYWVHSVLPKINHGNAIVLLWRPGATETWEWTCSGDQVSLKETPTLQCFVLNAQLCALKLHRYSMCSWLHPCCEVTTLKFRCFHAVFQKSWKLWLPAKENAVQWLLKSDVQLGRSSRISQHLVIRDTVNWCSLSNGTHC